MTFARAAVECDREANKLVPLDLHTSPKPTRAPDSPTSNSDWTARQIEKVAAAEAITPTLKGAPLRHHIRHLAALRRALTLGPEGLALSAKRARAGRSLRS
jgi:hypothetical protein